MIAAAAEVEMLVVGMGVIAAWVATVIID